MSALKVAIVDNHIIFRTGIKCLLNDIGNIKIIFEAANGAEMIDRLNANNLPNIICMDINMPVMNGIQAAQWLRKHFPEVPIIVISMFNDSETVLTMLKLGVRSYLLKDTAPSEFKDALSKVADGGVYFPDFVTNYLLANFNQGGEAVKLSEREVEFLKLTATELTYTEIARKMGVSVRTVDALRDILFEKLSIRSRVGLVLYGIKNKLVEL